MKIKKWNEKRKIKDLTTEESGEQPSYSSCTEKPKSRNLIMEELLGEQPFYKEPIKKKKKRKQLSNLELLQVLPFYDDVGVFKRQRAHKNCLGSYDVEFIVKNSLSDSLFSSKKRVKRFNDLLREKTG